MTSTRGISLIELLLTLALLVIIAGLAAPSFGSLLQKIQLRSAANHLFQGINTARSTAIMRQTTVSLSNRDGNWNSELELFLDTDGDGQRGDDEELLRRLPSREAPKISGNRLVSDYIKYLGDGSARRASGAFQVGTLTLCQPGLAEAYQLILSNGGRLRMTKTTVERCD